MRWHELVDRYPQVAHSDAGGVIDGVGDGGGGADDAELADSLRAERVDVWIKEPEGGVHVMGSEKFAELMSGLGVSDDTTIVAYDDFNSTFATRLWWVLSYFGHSEARVLNGGWDRWLAESRSITRAEVEPEAGADKKKDGHHRKKSERHQTGSGPKGEDAEAPVPSPEPLLAVRPAAGLSSQIWNLPPVLPPARPQWRDSRRDQG